MTVGIYDAASEKEQDKIREQADIYLEAFAEADGKNMKNKMNNPKSHLHGIYKLFHGVV